MSERSFILIFSLPSSVRNYEKTLQAVRSGLPDKTELLLPMQAGAVIGFSAEALEGLGRRIREVTHEQAIFVIVELGGEWETGGWNVAYRWLDHQFPKSPDRRER